MKKNYLLNNTVQYVPKERMLSWIVEGKELTQILNLPVNRCLELLIMHQGKLVPQRQFFEYVWGEYGSQVTMNTFYQNISLLRKALESAGINGGHIKTIQRRGIILSDKIIIVTLAPTQEEKALIKTISTENPELSPTETSRTAAGITDHQLSSALPENKSTSISSAYNEKGSHNKAKIVLLLLSSIFLFALCAMMFNSIKDENLSYFHHYLPFNAPTTECQVYVNDGVISHEKHAQFLSRYGATYCKNNHHLYLTLYPGNPRLSLMICDPKTSNTQRNNCVSIYYRGEMP